MTILDKFGQVKKVFKRPVDAQLEFIREHYDEITFVEGVCERCERTSIKP